MRINNESYFTFSGGEVHCRIPEIQGPLVVLDYTMNGFMALAEHVNILRRNANPIHVVYPYFPYARQDRVIHPDEPFSLSTFCDLLNSLKLDSVEIWDPHSDVAPALIHNCKIIPQWKLATQCIPYELFANKDVLFVSPDAGAYKKVSQLILDDKRIIVGVKNRNLDGTITHTSILSNVEISGKECVIVDDICDGGKTFIELAKALKQRGATKIHLYVTHGIFSKGISLLTAAGIEHIYTTNSFTNAGFLYEQVVTVRKII